MNDLYLSIFEKHGLRVAKHFGSKSGYRDRHPKHLVVFNARIYLKSTYEKLKNTKIRDFFKGQEEEIWYGDIDFNINIYSLYLIQMEIEEGLVVTDEMGNKMVEVGDNINRHWVGQIGKKGITLKDLFKRKK